MASWSDEIKNLLREHPKVFSTRVIMRSFAYKKFNSVSELKSSIQQFIGPKSKKAAQKTPNVKASYKTMPGDKKAVKTALTSYLVKQKTLSKVIKDEITKAFLELKLI